jgi:23S rRNA pseudouridine2605 synthase
MQERLQKALAAAGIASRRGAEELITAGLVSVNGRTAHVGQVIDRDRDVVEVSGRRVAFPEARTYIALNKPMGYVTSLRSTHGEKTVTELVVIPARVFPVGRLDKDTSGLLLFTDDGDWANIVSHPRFGVEKEYGVTVRGRLSPGALERLRRGVQLQDGAVTSPARVAVTRVEGTHTRLSVTVIEGKKRQIRLMFEAVGHPVVTLSRVRIGPLELGGLGEGRWRRLDSNEVEGIRSYGRRAAATDGSTRAIAGRR